MTVWTLRRSAGDAKVAGLCGGIAQHTGVDPVLIRLGAVLLALSGGVGLVLYFAGWLLIPVQGRTDAPVHDVLGPQTRRWSREVWVVLVVFICIAVFGVVGSLTPFGFGPAVILALLWYFGYYKNRPQAADQKTAPPAAVPAATAPPVQFFSYPGPPTAFTEAAQEWRRRVEEVTQGAGSPSFTGPSRGPGAAAPAPWAQAAPASPPDPEPAVTDWDVFLTAPDPVGLYDSPAPSGATAVAVPRARSRAAGRLRLGSLLVLVLVLAGLGVAAASGAPLTPAVYCSAALLVLGLTLVAAAWVGRARGILPLALLALVATIATSVGGPVAAQRGWGDHRVVHTTAAGLVAGDTWQAGRLGVDLTRVRLAADTRYTAHLEAGDLSVAVPPGVNVVVTWTAPAGVLLVDDEETRSGSDQPQTVQVVDAGSAAPTLNLQLSVNHGVVEVKR